MTARLDERPVLPLLAILLVALVLGAAHLWWHPPDLAFNWENRWWQIAVSLARGDGYVACKPIYFPFCGPANQITAMREPLPVLLLAAVALVTGESLLAAAAVGLLLNLAVVVAVFVLTRELADTRAGILAALLWACYLPPVRTLYAQPSGDLPAALTITVALFFVLRGRRTGRPTEWLAAGLFLGLAVLSRSAALIVTLALAGGQVIWPHAVDSPRSGLWTRLRPAALLLLTAGLVVAPWFVRNYVAFGRPVVGSTLGGYYLYRQNHILAGDDYLRFVTGGEFVPVIHAMIARRDDLQGGENEAEMDRIYRDEGLRVIRAEPLRFFRLSAYRFLMLWFDWGVKEAYGLTRSPGDHLTVLQHILLLAGGYAGLRYRRQRGLPLALSVLAFSLLCMGIMAHMLYAAAVVPLLVALTAAACTRSRLDKNGPSDP